MSFLTQRRHVPAGYTFFEFVDMAADEVVVIPVFRSPSKNGDTTLAISGTTGFRVSYTIEPLDEVVEAMRQQPFISSANATDAKGRSFPAVASPASFARVWAADVTLGANVIHEIKAHATALRLTAPATPGAFVIVFGDY